MEHTYSFEANYTTNRWSESYDDYNDVVHRDYTPTLASVRLAHSDLPDSDYLTDREIYESFHDAIEYVTATVTGSSLDLAGYGGYLFKILHRAFDANANCHASFPKTYATCSELDSPTYVYGDVSYVEGGHSHVALVPGNIDRDMGGHYFTTLLLFNASPIVYTIPPPPEHPLDPPTYYSLPWTATLGTVDLPITSYINIYDPIEASP
jgi:hypothetical protein